MKESASSIKFYEHLGKLFYAIAASDKNVAAEEIKTLEDIVTSYWVDKESEHPEQNALGILHEFINLQNKQDLSSNDCFREFLAFKDQNNDLFDTSITQLTLQTANAIASSFSSRNKSELIMLAKLDMAMKNNRSNP